MKRRTKRIKVSPLIPALLEVLRALQPLTEDERSRVLYAVGALLGEER